MVQSHERRRMVVNRLTSVLQDQRLVIDEDSSVAVRRFAHERDFLCGGAVISDVDGTLMLQGQDGFCNGVSTAVNAIATLGRPVVLNTLRTPAELQEILARSQLNTVQAFPVVTLNGGLSGIIHLCPDGKSSFEELHAQLLSHAEFDEISAAIGAIPLAAGHAAVVVGFHRDGRRRPTIWHRGGRFAATRAALWNGITREFDSQEQLIEQLHNHQICMLYVIHELDEGAGGPGSSLIVTGGGMNKQRGAESVSNTLDLILDNCIGSGDSSLDSFLSVVGCGVHIGKEGLPFRSSHTTIKVDTPANYGALLREFSAIYMY